MADGITIDGDGPDLEERPPEEAPDGGHKRALAWKALRILGWIVIALLALIVLLIGFLHTKPGRDFIVEQISSFAPASGLSVDVGSIDGSVLWSSTLNDVKVYDANGTLFLEVPSIDLNWRPYKFLWSGLDVRGLVVNGGTLYALPELNPGDPDAPILPDFDIRVDRFAIQDLTIAEGLIGDERTVSFQAKADIRDGLVSLDSEGSFGGGDVFSALVYAEPDGNRFDLDLDWRAPRGGFLAEMVGATDTLVIDLDGTGTWTQWNGQFVAQQGDIRLADLDITNRDGRYRIAGAARPGPYLEGLPAQALGETVQLVAEGTLENSVLDGRFELEGSGVAAAGVGAIDLANNAFDNLRLNAQLLDPALFGPDLTLTDARVDAVLDGAFRELDVPHTIRVGEIDAGGTIVRDLVQKGTLTYDGTRFTLPLDARIGRVVSGNELVDPRLNNGRIMGTLVYSGSRLLSDNLDIQFPGLQARLGLNSDFATGVTQLTGPVNIADLMLENIGTVDAGARIDFRIGGGAPWQLAAQLQGRLDDVTNETLVNLAGANVRFDGGIAIGGAAPLVFSDFNIDATKLTAHLDGRVDDGTTTLAGRGRHVEYGPFTVEATIAEDGPRATLVFADPFPAAGLTDVRVTLAPTPDGFQIETNGGSSLGAFDGLVFLNIANDGTTSIDISRLDVADTRVEGTLQLVEGGIAGDLGISRGGVDGTVALAVRDGGQGFDVDLTMDNARFGGATPLTIAQGRVDATGLIAPGNTTITGNARIQGLNYGSFFVGRLAAQAQVVNGAGHFDAALNGRRGGRFELLVNGDVASDRIAVAVDGSYAGRDISMPRRAVLTRAPGGGWELQRSQFTYGDGFVIASGRFGGSEPTQGRLAFSDLPLDLADVAGSGLGLGGTISGVVDLATGPGGLPTGEARIKIDDLTRSSALLTSSPMDIALVADLSPSLLQARAVMADGRGAQGRVQARIANLPQGGGLAERLYAGDLFAQMRFSGSAAALWRLAAIDLIDLTGPVAVAADIRGTLGNPQVRGSLSGDNLRVRSTLTGTDITNVAARGRFNGSRLNLTSFAGDAPGGGRINGSGFVDLANMGAGRGPRIDLRMAARNARILNLENMGATVTGPMRIVSNGVGGTIAGRLTVNEARWSLGGSEAIAQLPSVEITEVNLPADIAPVNENTAPWRYLLDIRAPGGIKVDGMGLDSEWRTENLQVRGTTDDPRVDGSVSIVPRQGFYEFAGVRFEITRGEIYFDRNVPIDPRIDLIAETDTQNLSVTVNVRGNASQPEITFSSVPALPEEELLAQLLFGGSIANLSATDALQLGSAVASLRGGGGAGPINQLRDAIGLDRLRIVPADPALDRGTSVALGKNFGRKLYGEVITDGAGYNATSLEFRVTSWLNLLATVSTIGRQSVAAEYRRDY
ncbi:translocation/assembly module TamB domain-containing protein [Aurantiacibacter spongiae]|uniref:DUF490 domain-containing protein n=1 Tax=Aurantiacibacter spongiae TaxID=2488860 RepID=A0A3N5DS68_9SPHN|nr:translocation/assembly module TamB domain-containing protein [Aurantiacibacter spongiae]RPF72031.1 DUF490 domain-containing protein [Aurantiacibacter spongiae]